MPYPIIIVPFMQPDGMALFPFILIRDERDKRNSTLLRHEQIHLRQQLELLVLPFYILYLTNYLYNLYRYRNHRQAYRQIIFEREAYRHERDEQYLHRRKLWAWVRDRGER